MGKIDSQNPSADNYFVSRKIEIKQAHIKIAIGILLALAILLPFIFHPLPLSYEMRIFLRPLRQLFGGITQRITNPFINTPTQDEITTNPVLNKKLIPTLKRNSGMEKVAKEILREYTFSAKFQLESIPAGEFSASLSGVHGKSVLGAPVPNYQGGLSGGGYNRGGISQATYISDELPQNKWEGALRHVLLHTAIVNAGGLDTEIFMEDYKKMALSHNRLYLRTERFISSPFYSGASDVLLAEEIFSQLGAWEGQNIFKTPVGKHYQHILKEHETLFSRNIN